MIKEFSKVRLITDNYKSEGVKRGTKEIVLECYPTGDYEVQFEDENGNPIDKFFAVHSNEIEPII